MKETREANSIRIGRCTNPRCGALHIMMLDDNDECFAEASLPIADVPAFIATIEEATAAVGGVAPDEGHA